MITAAITSAIVAVLTAAGVEPGPYIAPLAIGVKLLVVTPLVAGVMWWKKRRDEKPAAGGAA